MSVLDIRNLSLSLDGRAILKDISLSVAAGEIVALVGESGSGKSMTALAVLGLAPSHAVVTGEIILHGQSLTTASEKTLNALRGREMAIVFQEPMTALNPVMTIGDQVAETIRQHKKLSRRDARLAAQAMLDRVGLPAGRISPDRYPHELSGGQRQRVAIAIAVALTPRLLIADEATTALDVTTQAQILDLLKRLAREDGTALVLITHDLAVTAGMADRVVVLKDGEVVETGDVRRILSNAGHPYVRNLTREAMHAPAPRRAINRDAQPVLQVESLIRDYPGRRKLFGRSLPFRAVDGVSLSIQPGESVGLVGESGCGKSTLLRAILGLEPLQGGRVLVRGQDMARARGAELRRLRRDIQMVFQDPFSSFDPRWTAARAVAENLHLLDERPTPLEARRSVDQMLERVGLSASDGDRYPHEFSGGQRQRLAIARALMTRPAMVALDEAVSALDVATRRRILDLLAELSRDLGLAYLFVAHDLGVVRGATDRVLVMQAGRIVEQGETDRVFAAPAHPYTQKLLAATPDLMRNIEALNAQSRNQRNAR